jgi:hypothetical protein
MSRSYISEYIAMNVQIHENSSITISQRNVKIKIHSEIVKKYKLFSISSFIFLFFLHETEMHYNRYHTKPRSGVFWATQVWRNRKNGFPNLPGVILGYFGVPRGQKFWKFFFAQNDPKWPLNPIFMHKNA